MLARKTSGAAPMGPACVKIVPLRSEHRKSKTSSQIDSNPITLESELSAQPQPLQSLLSELKLYNCNFSNKEAPCVAKHQCLKGAPNPVQFCVDASHSKLPKMLLCVLIWALLIAIQVFGSEKGTI